ncbi:MAG: Maf family protein, partial [Firmicutes bacterium]|nr:Maf family protein [Bacillota bacterium]
MLRDIGKDPVILRPECPETVHTGLTPRRTVMALALRKLLWVRENLLTESLPDDFLMLSSDTVVSFRGEILGKPADEADAFRMLKEMSGNKNTVYSSCCAWH